MDISLIETNEQMLDLAALVSFNRAVGNGNAIKALFDAMAVEFEKYHNKATEEHYITNTITSPVKSDAIKAYVSKMVKLAMNIQFADLKGFSNLTLGHDNSTTLGIITSLCTTQINSHQELFERVAVHLCGYDLSLVRSGIEPMTYRRFRHLLVYVIGKFSLANGYQPIRNDDGVIIKDDFDLLLDGQLTDFEQDPDLCKFFFANSVDIVTMAIEHRFNNSRISVLSAILNATRSKAKAAKEG